MLCKSRSRKTRGRDHTSHMGQGEPEGSFDRWSPTEELLEKPGAYPKEEEVKVSVKAAFRHQKGCHRDQRPDSPCMGQEVRARDRG